MAGIDIVRVSYKGMAQAVGSSAEQFATAVRADMQRMGKVIRDAGIPAQ